MRSCQRWMRSKKIQIKWYHRKIWNNKYFSKFERCRAILMFEKKKQYRGIKAGLFVVYLFFSFSWYRENKTSKQAKVEVWKIKMICTNHFVSAIEFMMIHLQRAHDFVGLLVSLVLSVPKNLQYFQFCSKAKTNDRCMGAYIINSGLCIETVFF